MRYFEIKVLRLLILFRFSSFIQISSNFFRLLKISQDFPRFCSNFVGFLRTSQEFGSETGTLWQTVVPRDKARGSWHLCSIVRVYFSYRFFIISCLLFVSIRVYSCLIVSIRVYSCLFLGGVYFFRHFHDISCLFVSIRVYYWLRVYFSCTCLFFRSHLSHKMHTKIDPIDTTRVYFLFAPLVQNLTKNRHQKK